MIKYLKRLPIVPVVILLFLLLFIVSQGYFIWTDYARIQLGIVKRYSWIASAERSSLLIMKSDPAKYLRFLNLYLPQDVSIVLPPVSAVGDLQRQKWFSDQNMMQFYLFPRTIITCDQGANSSCIQYLTNPNMYVLAFSDFPPPEYMENRVLIKFPEAVENINGVYVPSQDANRLAIPGQIDYGKWDRVPITALPIDAGILLAFLILGFAFVSLLIPQPTWLEIFGLSFPLAIGLYSWLSFLTSYLGVEITLFTSILWFVLLFMVGVSLHRLFWKSWPVLPKISISRSIEATWRENRVALFLGLAVLLWFGLNGLISIGRGYSTFDEIANWSLKGYAMAFQHSIWASNLWGGHIMAYPMNEQLSITLFRLADGDVLPGSKVLFPIMAISLLLGCYRFWRQQGVNNTLALMGMLLLFTTPFFFQYSSQGYANGPFTTYIVLGILWSLEGLLNHSFHSILLGGLLFAFAGWTRPEGIGYSLILLAVIYLCVILLFKIKLNIKQIASSLLPTIVFPILWLILVGAKNMQRDQIGGVLSTFGKILNGQLNLEAWGEIAKFAKTYFTWWQQAGFVVPIAIFIIIILLPISRWFKNRLQLSVFVITLVTFLLPAAIFFVNSFSESDFRVFLSVSFDRAYLPALTMLVINTIFLLNPVFESYPNPMIEAR